MFTRFPVRIPPFESVTKTHLQKQGNCGISELRPVAKPDAWSCIITSPFASGGFGKARVAELHDPACDASYVGLLCIKEVPCRGRRFGWRQEQARERNLQECAREITFQNTYSPLKIVRAFVNPQGNAYLLMALMDGGTACTLRDKIGDDAEFSNVVRYVLWKVVTQIATLHAGGFMHCDVKPRNILWNTDGAVALADFGLARERSREVKRKSGGTWGYRAPEIFNGPEGGGAAVDVWALGVAAIRMYELQNPFFLLRAPIAYEDYRQHVMSAASPADVLNREDAPSLMTRRFHHVFHQLWQLDAPLCGYLLGAVLVSNPCARHSAQQVAEHLENEIRFDENAALATMARCKAVEGKIASSESGSAAIARPAT